jgi:hypothetical protein
VFGLSGGGSGAEPESEPCVVDNVVLTCPNEMLAGEQIQISYLPEPGTIVLFGTGLIPFIIGRKRQFRVQT